MTFMIQIRNIAVALRIGLSFGRVPSSSSLSADSDTPTSVEAGATDGKQTTVGFQRNPPAEAASS